MRHEKVLVTGGSGLLGRFVVEELAGNCDLSVLDLVPPAGDRRFFEADLMRPESLAAALAGQQAVIHLAGMDLGNAAHDRDYMAVNVQGTWNLLHAAEAAGVKQVVIASSIASLGIDYDHAPDYLPVDEAHPQRPTGTYGLSKQLIEAVARHFVRRGALRIICLRPVLVIWPEQEPAVLAQLALSDPDSDAPADHAGAVAPDGALSATRAYVRARDAARAFSLALDYAGDPYDCFIISAADGIGRVETLERMTQVFGRLPELRDPAHYARDPHAAVYDIRRAADRLGWAPDENWRAVAGGL